MSKNKIEVGAVYKHYKGNFYRVLAVAKHSETLEDMVVYIALYGEGEIWTRPLSMWNDLVNYQGQTVSRFKKVEDI